MNSLENSLQFYTQSIFNKDIWFSIASIDYFKLMNTWDFQSFFKNYSSLNLLDIGCGTGKFPSMLSNTLETNPIIQTDFLDPSDFCLQEYKKNLTYPFIIGKEFLTTVERFLNKEKLKKYDLIWAVHSLYCVEKKFLSNQLHDTFNLLSNEHSKFLIYIANSKSSYYKIKNLYDNPEAAASPLDFIWAEDIENALSKIPKRYRFKTITFDHVVKQDNVQYYLSQCVFNQKFLTASISSKFQKWLDLHYDGKNFIFPQEVVLFELN